MIGAQAKKGLKVYKPVKVVMSSNFIFFVWVLQAGRLEVLERFEAER